MPHRVLIVDDERLARARLRRMLAAFPEVAVVGEAGGVDAAVSAIASLEPDTIFLDVQMPSASGFALFDRCAVRARVVFVTAFDEYALRAFEVNALDYLLKPVAPERLAACLARLDGPEAATTSARLTTSDRVCIGTDDGLRFVDVTTVLAIRAAGDYTEVYLADGSAPLTRLTMTQWEGRLPAHTFSRVHRSAIIQLAVVDRLQRRTGGALAHLRGLAEPVPVSRRVLTRVAATLREREGQTKR
ncbi:MAG: LytTR family DNA-binding domain-containing protein [Myxococcota bacterium]